MKKERKTSCPLVIAMKATIVLSSVVGAAIVGFIARYFAQLYFLH